ncbi:MAG TPA: isoamylase early set domain-containing protein [Gemmatimonadaceae bacterium]|nr:isoamylase early set domain-containing protein [Gemmatimonadaceae bacterium]
MSEWERDGLVDAVVRELRRPVAMNPMLDARVMAEIRAGHRRQSALAACWAWLRRPRNLTLTPLGGLAFAGAAFAFVMITVQAARQPSLRSERESAAVAMTPGAVVSDVVHDANDAQSVRFVLVAPRAASVSLVGDFNDWQLGATPLQATAQGRTWVVDVPLTPGRHRYAFVVDGEQWLPDPVAPPAPGDDFGQPSSVVTVSASMPGRIT